MHAPVDVKYDKIFFNCSLRILYRMSGDPHDPEIVHILILVS